MFESENSYFYHITHIIVTILRTAIFFYQIDFFKFHFPISSQIEEEFYFPFSNLQTQQTTLYVYQNTMLSASVKDYRKLSIFPRYLIDQTQNECNTVYNYMSTEKIGKRCLPQLTMYFQCQSIDFNDSQLTKLKKEYSSHATVMKFVGQKQLLVLGEYCTPGPCF